MNWMTKFLMGQMLLMEKAGDDKGGGGGTPDPKDAEIAALKAELEKAKGAPPKETPKPDDKSLEEKARLEREENEKKSAQTKVLESAIRFNLSSKDWVKNNATLLPVSVQGIFDQAEKENYGSDIHKSNAIRVGVVSEFFAVKDNLDLLTAHQKQTLEDFLKLTKTVKEERVQGVYDSIFEPTLESLRKVKKAEALQKGLGTPSDAEDAYTKKLMAGSAKYHLGEKNA